MGRQCFVCTLCEVLVQTNYNDVGGGRGLSFKEICGEWNFGPTDEMNQHLSTHGTLHIKRL
jgi:hypothetical protein